MDEKVVKYIRRQVCSWGIVEVSGGEVHKINDVYTRAGKVSRILVRCRSGCMRQAGRQVGKGSLCRQVTRKVQIISWIMMTQLETD